MKKMLRKSAAILSSAMIASVLAIPSLTAFAADEPVRILAPQKLATDSIDESTVFNVPKDIVLFNADGSSIYEPNVIYSYSVDTAEPSGATITLKDEETSDIVSKVTVRKGIAGAVTIKGTSGDYSNEADIQFGDTDSASYSADDLYETIDDDGTSVVTSENSAKKVSKDMSVKIDASVIYAGGVNPAGVYRYLLTDTTEASTLTAAGIDRDDDYVDNLYLDVYTKSKKDSETGAVNGLEVYGYVLFKSNNANHSFEEIYDESIIPDSDNVKVTGFDTNSELDGENVISDQYHTYNVNITKKVDGDLADSKNEFPFYVGLSNGTIKNSADFYYKETEGVLTKGTLGSDGSWSLGAAAETSELTLNHNDTFTITGLPKSTKINFSEYNNTKDVYTVSAKMNESTDVITAQQVNAGASASMENAVELTKIDEYDNIIVTNKLEEISVTGLLFTYAPYAAFIGVGTLFIGLFIRNKKRKHEDSEI